MTLHLPNCADFIVSWFALAKIGAIMVPTNVLSTAAEMEYFMAHSESILLITEEEYLDKFQDIKSNLPNLQHTLITRCTNSQLQSISVDHLIEQAVEEHAPYVSIRGDDVVSIMYTSGTTSKPKGCMITHTNYIYTGGSRL
ncbi:AMP-binding protein [Virgibacillus halophilus]|uniref:AMP-binding protein n=1 Tax=Tigheibacillus halophilus TaxID=361280 RepID=A0ABU5C2M5_9BACI|nr:AMP-binding protein [Virgibacillus halophilus]